MESKGRIEEEEKYNNDRLRETWKRERENDERYEDTSDSEREGMILPIEAEKGGEEGQRVKEEKF